MNPVVLDNNIVSLLEQSYCDIIIRRQLHCSHEEADYLDPFSSAFRPELGIEVTTSYSSGLSLFGLPLEKHVPLGPFISPSGYNQT